nr:MAG: hypothetical protein DIU80_24070 [Chloroflexota bacterium]
MHTTPIDVITEAARILLMNGWQIERLVRVAETAGCTVKATLGKWTLYFDADPGRVDEGVWELPSEGKYIRFKRLDGLMEIAQRTPEHHDKLWHERKSEQRQGPLTEPREKETFDDFAEGNDDEPSITDDVTGAFDDLEERLAFAAPEMVKFHLDNFRQEILDIVSSEN